ncbi:hypothetical protein M758_5G035400 [Ceratodon purpureus]|nr:hypothetical protein M758_5G035400 [Ceratodon purpureus]
MGRLMGEYNMRTPRSNKHQLIIKEAAHVDEGRSFRIERAGSLDGNDGGLPLFFPTASRNGSFRLGSNAGDLNTEDVNFKHVEAGWPFGSQEIAAWASSFRFELDSEDAERLQTALERDAQISGGETDRRKLADSANLTEGAPSGGSFRFQSGNQSGYLKPPRQLEKFYGSNRFTVVANACANEKQGCDAAQSGDGLSVVQVQAARIKVAVNDYVPASPGRSEILRRLTDLKAHPLSPRQVPDDAVSYHKEKAKMAAVRDELHGRLKISLPLLKDEYYGKGSSSPASKYQSKPQENALGELEIMSNIGERRRQSSSPSGLRGSPRRPPQWGSQEHPITPTSRFRNGDEHPTTPTSRFRNGERQLVSGSSIQEQIVSIRKQPHAAAGNVSNTPSPEHPLSVPGAIPFKWEEEPGKPKTIAAAANRALARRLSREGIEVSNCTEMKSGSQKDDIKPITDELESGNSGRGIEAPARSSSDTGNGDPIGRTGSFRFYGRAQLSKHSREASLGRSSRRYSTQEKEAHIDLDASAAAKFLVESFGSPSRSPSLHGSSPTNFAVPFKWEATPGKPKVERIVRSPNLLQLPPRLAVPSYRSAESFSRELRASHPFSGFFAPCMTAPDLSPVHHKQRDRGLMQFTPSKSLPPKVPQTPERRKRHGLVGRCSSAPREGCQIRVSKSFDDKPSCHSSSEKVPVGHISTASSPGLKPRNLFISELQNDSNGPSSPTSILCGPEESSSQTSTSNTAFSSGELEDFTQQGTHSQKSASKSSSSASYESIEEEFAELPAPSYSVPAPPPSGPQHSEATQGTSNQALGSTIVNTPEIKHNSRRWKGRPDTAKTLLKLPTTGKHSAKLKTHDQLDTTYTPENSSPALSNYFQCLDPTEAATSTSTSTEDVSLLDKQRAPTSSGYLNTEGAPLSPLSRSAFPTSTPMTKQDIDRSPHASPKRPTRLPYTMPSAAEQFLASCSTSGRRQLIQDLSPRLLHQYSGRRLSASHSGSNTPRIDRSLTSSIPHASHGEHMSPSPAYAASLELFSPAAIIPHRRKWPGTPARAPLVPPPKPRRRSRFMLSICKSLKRALCRKSRRKVKELPHPRVMYLHDGRSPSATFRFKTSYT